MYLFFRDVGKKRNSTFPIFATRKLFSKKHPRGKYSKHYSSRDFNSEINIFNRQKGENKYKKHRSKGDIPQLDGQFTHNQLKQLSRLYS
jgi:hypothetical protein